MKQANVKAVISAGKIAVLLSALLLPSVSSAALNSYLELSCNGTLIDGEPTVQSIGGVDVSNHIEVVGFGFNAINAVDSTGRISGRRTYRPIRFVKRIDSATPLILQALIQNQICEATFRFFRPNPAGDGTTEHYFTVELSRAAVAGVMPSLASTLDPANASLPPLESVSLVFQQIRVVHETSGAEVFDDISATSP